jgi:hypothetical protein
MDSQSVKTTSVGGVRGYDGGKKLSGRKRHLLVDTLGLVLRVTVHTADIQDRAAVPEVLTGVKERFARLAQGGWIRAIPVLPGPGLSSIWVGVSRSCGIQRVNVVNGATPKARTGNCRGVHPLCARADNGLQGCAAATLGGGAVATRGRLIGCWHCERRSQPGVLSPVPYRDLRRE